MKARMASTSVTFEPPNFAGFGAKPLAIQGCGASGRSNMRPGVPRFRSAMRYRNRRSPVSGRTTRIWDASLGRTDDASVSVAGSLRAASSASISSARARKSTWEFLNRPLQLWGDQVWRP